MRPLLLLTALGLSGCAPREVDFPVTVVTGSCDPASSPLDGVQFIRVRVMGPGIVGPLEATTAVGGRAVAIPGIPAGADRIVEVRGYDADPAGGGRVLSLGRSAPFSVPDRVPAARPASISVFLRRVNAFSAPVDASGRGCLRLSVPHAGHTATRLANGEVLIAGGYTLDAGLPTALSQVERFDPATGQLALARGLATARAFHTASLVPLSGQVALWGGEAYSTDGGSPTSLASLVFYDPDVDDYARLPPSTSPPLARAHHGAAFDSSGRLLVAGGRSGDGSPVAEVEWVDPATAQQGSVAGASVPRLDPVVAPLGGGGLVAVAGGSDGRFLSTEVELFQSAASAGFVQKPSAHLMAPGRRAAGWGTLKAGADLLLLGGYSDPAADTPLTSSEIVDGSTEMVRPGPTVLAVGAPCAVTLADGRVVALGGRSLDASGLPQSDPQTLVVTPDAEGKLASLGGPPLPVSRWAHSCTALADGTVLVAGGVSEGNGLAAVLDDLWIYQPGPLD